MFPVRALRYVGYWVLILMPWLWSSGRLSGNMVTREFYQTISFAIFLVVAFGLHGWDERRSKPSGPNSP
jgi:hypothetical protein